MVTRESKERIWFGTMSRSAPVASQNAPRCSAPTVSAIDPVAIPDRLKQSVGETKRYDALDRVLSEKVVDPEDLILAQRAEDLGVQLARRVQAVVKWLFDHHSTPEPMLAVLALVLIR